MRKSAIMLSATPLSEYGIEAKNQAHSQSLFYKLTYYLGAESARFTRILLDGVATSSRFTLVKRAFFDLKTKSARTGIVSTGQGLTKVTGMAGGSGSEYFIYAVPFGQTQPFTRPYPVTLVIRRGLFWFSLEGIAGCFAGLLIGWPVLFALTARVPIQTVGAGGTGVTTVKRSSQDRE